MHLGDLESNGGPLDDPALFTLARDERPNTPVKIKSGASRPLCIRHGSEYLWVFEGAFALFSDSELGLCFGDASTEAALDFFNSLALSEVSGLVEMLQKCAQLIEEFAR